MSPRRSVSLTAVFAAVLATPAAGQTASSGASRPPFHHDAAVPDYAAAIRRLDSILVSIPAPPLDDAYRVALHHDATVPDYFASLRPERGRVIAIPPPPRGGVPAVVRGLYANAWVFGSDRFYDLVRLADTTEVNALVIDVKDATGYLTYRSAVPTAQQIGANRLVRAKDARQRLEMLRARGIHPIARIVVARDPLLARGKPDWAVHDVNGGLWRDGLGEAWVDAYHDSVWVYAAEIAAEAVLMGFEEVQFDYLRFPDEPPHRLSRAVFPAKRAEESRRGAIRRNVALLRDRVKSLGVPFTLDIFGLTTSADGDLGIGQNWDDLVQLADVVLPMVYPSHYGRGAYGIAHPNAEPYRTVRRALEEGIARSRSHRNPAQIRPYLQSFSIFGVRYSAAEVRAQIQAVEDVGLTDWILWNARGVYPAAAFRTDGLAGRAAVVDGSSGSGQP